MAHPRVSLFSVYARISRSNVLKEEFIHATMAKRLSKALRGKRRWVGIECTAQFASRSSLATHLSNLFESIEQSGAFELMEFYAAGSEVAIDAVSALDGSEPRGFGILQIPHSAYQAVRQLLEREDSLSTHAVHSLTSSGKIRLVRERLNLPRPIRDR
jgi:hypothetical protein